MKLYDVRLTIDGLMLADDEDIDDIIKKIKDVVNTSHEILVDVDYVEHFD